MDHPLYSMPNLRWDWLLYKQIFDGTDDVGMNLRIFGSRNEGTDFKFPPSVQFAPESSLLLNDRKGLLRM